MHVHLTPRDVDAPGLARARHLPTRKEFQCLLPVLCLSAQILFPPLSRAATFLPPELITDGVEQYHLSRTANGHMAFDTDGILHVVYWAGGLVTNPSTPSSIYYRTWTEANGWSVPTQIDNSAVPEGRIGGRHPSLAITPDDTVWIVWHDHRHCTGPNWIDNIEIYGDFRPPGGEFTSTDFRLTTSMANHNGDNGYAPKIIAHDSGRLTVSWYDFNLASEISDIYLRTSDEAGRFDPAEAMDAMRVTNKDDRGGTPLFALPDLAIDSDGTRHLAWAGGQGAGVDLFYGEGPPGTNSITVELLAADGTDFFGPPHIAIGPNDDVWIAYGDETPVLGENVVLLRRRAGEALFDAPITILPDPARQFSPDHEIDSFGRVHVVWIDQRKGQHVYYALYDPRLNMIVDAVQITEISGFWTKPTLTLDAEENVYVLFEELRGLAESDLWFTRTATPPNPTGVETAIWEAYR